MIKELLIKAYSGRDGEDPCIRDLNATYY